MNPGCEGLEPAGLLRRFGAAVYDGLLVLALWLVIGLLWVLLGEATGHAPIPVLLVLQLLSAGAFFIWFWTRTGQTLGMQAWSISLCDETNRGVGRWPATLRFLVALAQWLLLLLAVHLGRTHGAAVTITITALLVFLLGLSLRHPERLMLHDLLSGTRLRRLARTGGAETAGTP